MRCLGEQIMKAGTDQQGRQIVRWTACFGRRSAPSPSSAGLASPTRSSRLPCAGLYDVADRLPTGLISWPSTAAPVIRRQSSPGSGRLLLSMRSQARPLASGWEAASQSMRPLAGWLGRGSMPLVPETSRDRSSTSLGVRDGTLGQRGPSSGVPSRLLECGPRPRPARERRRLLLSEMQSSRKQSMSEGRSSSRASNGSTSTCHDASAACTPSCGTCTPASTAWSCLPETLVSANYLGSCGPGTRCLPASAPPDPRTGHCSSVPRIADSCSYPTTTRKHSAILSCRLSNRSQGVHSWSARESLITNPAATSTPR
jgi:hypothetical protein